MVMPAQQEAPRMRGLPPDFTSFTVLVFRPMAAMARTMTNLLRVLTGANTAASTPRETATVVIMEAPMKYRMKKGRWP